MVLRFIFIVFCLLGSVGFADTNLYRDGNGLFHYIKDGMEYTFRSWVVYRWPKDGHKGFVEPILSVRANEEKKLINIDTPYAKFIDHHVSVNSMKEVAAQLSMGWSFDASQCDFDNFPIKSEVVSASPSTGQSITKITYRLLPRSCGWFGGFLTEHAFIFSPELYEIGPPTYTSTEETLPISGKSTRLNQKFPWIKSSPEKPQP